MTDKQKYRKAFVKKMKEQDMKERVRAAKRKKIKKK